MGVNGDVISATRPPCGGRGGHTVRDADHSFRGEFKENTVTLSLTAPSGACGRCPDTKL
jgi:hypothetical protein